MKEIVKQLRLAKKAINDGSTIIIGRSIVVGIVPQDRVVFTDTNEWFTVDGLDEISDMRILVKDPDYSRCDACGLLFESEKNEGIECNLCPDCAKSAKKAGGESCEAKSPGEAG